MRGASLATVALIVLLAGCGGSSAPAVTRPAVQLTPQEKLGKQLFVRNCGSCHALADAGTNGSAGPTLDSHPWRAVYVREVIASGPGLMPDKLLTGAQADAVAAYVAAVSRR